MADIASLGLEVRSDQVKKGAADLDRLTAAAARAEAAAMGVATGSRQAAAGAASVSSTSAQAAVALDREAAAAKRAAQSLASSMTVANDNARRMGGSMSGLAAQFQDIGVTAAAGMSPAIIGLQQGAQIAGQMEAAMQGGASAVSVLGTAFKSLLSPVTLVSIALTALAALGIQMVNWPQLAASALNGLADVLVTIAPYAVAAAAALALLYAPAIIGGVAAVTTAIWGMVSALGAAALAFVAANPAVAFVLGITAAIAAANIFRDELTQIFGRDIVGDVKNAVNWIIGVFVGAFRAIKASWSLLPSAIGDLVYQAADATIGGVEKMLNFVIGKIDTFIGKIEGVMSTVSGWIGQDGVKLGRIGSISIPRPSNPYAGAAADAASAAQGAFSSATSTDYVGATYDVIAKGASAASGKLKELAGWLTRVDEKAGKKGRGGGKSEADKYQDIVDGANRRIASLRAEQEALGLTEVEALRLKYTQDLLNEAQQKGITLTAAQRGELAGLADQMANIEVATKNAKEAIDFAKDATKGFLTDLRQGLANGESFWKAFGDAALNVLNKIIDKTQLVDALFSASSIGGGGGGGFLGGFFGWIGSLLGFARGGYTGGGPASRVAGVVHGGEYVFSKKATDRIGVGVLDALHRRAKGYAGGGAVDEVPRVFPAGNQNAPVMQLVVRGEEGPMFRPTIKAEANGVALKVVDDRAPFHVQRGIASYDKSLPGRISDVMERNG